MKLKELFASIVELLAPLVSIVIMCSVVYGGIYFLFGGKGVETYLSLRFSPLSVLTEFLGCGTDDANDWVGRWSESVHFAAAEKGFEQLYTEEFGQEVEVDLSTTYEFDSDGTFEWKISKVVQGKGLSLSGGMIVRGTYTLDSDSYLIEIRGQENIEVTGFVTEENIIDFAQTTRSGTWVRDGDRLTLTDNDNIVEVLKKE